MGRKNKRKSVFRGKHLFLYGRLQNRKIIGYCKYHSCCLSKQDLIQKRCIKKKCKRLLLK